uniref:Uncharacterized protein n=1 Tax=Arundo donax TaxID=35708 RepID=A0A0A9BZG3_ARUDO
MLDGMVYSLLFFQFRNKLLMHRNNLIIPLPGWLSCEVLNFFLQERFSSMPPYITVVLV